MPASARASIAALATQVELADLSTPFALIDEGVLRRNVEAMQEATVSIGASLRPHFKTHRTIAIACLQRDAGAIGLTVATAPQLAAVGREVGCPVLVSSLLQVDAAVAAHLREAAGAGNVAFAVESERSIERLRSALGPDVTADVMIEVEAGCMRSGVPAQDCADVARAAAGQGLDVVGLFSYPGQAYAPGVAKDAADQELAALELGASQLRRAGFDPAHISAGSTPTMPYARSGVATEYRPGTYVFGDRRLVALGAMERSQLALTVVATVVTVHDDRVVLDAGGKALGRDSLPWLPGYGELDDGSATIVGRLYDHHSVIEGYRGPPVRVGDRLAVVPNNANSVMALLRSAWLSGDGLSGAELIPYADR